MRRTLPLLALALLTACATSTPTAAPQPGSDEFAIETTVLASYNVVSGPAGRRDWGRFKELFADPAQVVIDGVATTPDAYSKSANGPLQTAGLFEHPVRTRVDRYRDTAQVWTVYESRHAAMDAQPYGRGVRCFQLVRSGESWKIVSMVTQPEDAAHPLPAR
jgi:hypothetical protein